MSTIINLYAGPGAGKSTSAAILYANLKTMHINAELVREYVKDFCWEERKIQQFDQLYFLGKQMRKENILLGKVDYIVTDSPVFLSLFYAHKFCSPEIAAGIQKIVQAYYQETAEQGHRHIHVFLRRSKPYQQAGRYQNEEEAKEIDVGVKTLMRNLNVPYVESETQDHALKLTLVNILDQDNDQKGIARLHP